MVMGGPGERTGGGGPLSGAPGRSVYGTSADDVDYCADYG